MSTFRAHATAIRQAEAIVEALVDRAKAHARQNRRSEAEAEAAVREHVELEAGTLRGYQGVTREADIILRRPHSQQLLGCSSYEDIGFQRTEDGTYQAVLSSHDYWWAQGGEARFMQFAQAHEAVMEASLEGYDVHVEEIEGGLLEVVCDETF